MNKQEFLAALRNALSGLPQEDIEQSIDFYSEMIEDRMEDGLSEEEATAAIGSVNDIVSKTLSETSLPKLVKAKVKPNRVLKAWEITLLVLGSPVWVPLFFAAVCVLLSVYIVIWSLIISLYAIDISFAAGGVAGILGAFAFLPAGEFSGVVLFVGIGLVCSGIAILLFFGFNKIVKSIIRLSKKMLLGIKLCFIGKGDVQ